LARYFTLLAVVQWLLRENVRKFAVLVAQYSANKILSSNLSCCSYKSKKNHNRDSGQGLSFINRSVILNEVVEFKNSVKKKAIILSWVVKQGVFGGPGRSSLLVASSPLNEKSLTKVKVCLKA